MNQKLISVIVPVYNTERYLRGCLDSLINQTLSEIEIIVVDDGSTDGSMGILEEYEKNNPSKIKVFHKENGGQATARNLAFRYCTGKYIGFIDSDDSACLDMFQKMYEAAVKNDADYVACGYTDFYIRKGEKITLNTYIASRKANTVRDLFIGALAPPWIHLYKKELIIQNKVYFPEGVVYEDTAFYLNMIPFISKIAIVEEPLVIRLRRKNSTMTTYKMEKVDDIFDVLRCSVDFYKKNDFYDTYRTELEYFCVRVLLCSSMQRISYVKPFSDARMLQKQTLSFIQKEFQGYRGNALMGKGIIHLYMKLFNGLTAPFVLLFMKIVNRFKRDYS